ncbi:hypothetical protein Aph01nite_05970 [Acrocarpospora phusangensis]|uniref:Peptidoglycan binding-like domain-containing protein n=1 Tax=Acrocarpospora phusangensis TaxID=1070424 RepID=A0A919Q9G4_9ACTN|nr:hypothetical protein [Acrocarpospora phusangensis]GIH22287.1 hypothetical protein Aph01nite_05970 [Acrocarpospora phusangensis]
MRKVMRILSALTLGLALLFVFPTPASADSVTWGWGDNHRLCRTDPSCVRVGNVVRLWQAIAVNALALPYEFIDGDYGPATEQATSRMFNGRTTVEPSMWQHIEAGIRYHSGDCPGSTEYYKWTVRTEYGYDNTLDLRMACTGVWSFFNPRTWAWTGTGH